MVLEVVVRAEVMAANKAEASRVVVIACTDTEVAEVDDPVVGTVVSNIWLFCSKEEVKTDDETVVIGIAFAPITKRDDVLPAWGIYVCSRTRKKKRLMYQNR